ncbi:hypothetical protein QVD17_21600 [Tagetes erecta]|uniref:ATG8-interacting protein 1 n=1 Tax=Tagetes erecta TaxID=13708 RepID=A0AAD8KC52_TARER|nr:hypothetical protein QVD17_21600 [Tagetes erecta]
MAEKEEAQVTTPRGADWEVVSLTASAYAASPGGSIPEFKHEEKGEMIDKNNLETSKELFMSGHFVYPPKQHEDSPSEPEKAEILENFAGKDDGSVSVNDLAGGFESNSKEEENWDLRKLTELGFTENSNLNFVGKEQSIYDSPALHSLHSEATIGSLNIDDETSVIDESVHSSDPISGPNTPNLPSEEENDEGSGYTVWFKKQAVCFYEHAKETNTLWSVLAAAAVMGIVIIGHKWQQEKWQVFRSEWNSRTPDEKIRMMAGPVSRIKYAILGSHQHDFSIRGSISGEL